MSLIRKILILFLSCLTFSPSAFAVEPEAISGRSSYIFLGNANYPPFIYLEQTATVGVVVDIAKAIIQKGQINAQFIAMDWAQAQEQVRGDKADALVLINKNPEREKLYDFSEPLLKSEFVIFRKSSRVDISDTGSLEGRTVGAEKGGYTTSLMQKFPLIRLQTVSDLREGFRMLERDQLDALITERWAGEFELAKSGFPGIVAVKQAVEASTSYIAVRKGNQALLEKINAGLRLIDEDGTRQLIQDRWSNKEVVHVTREKFNYYRIAVFLAFVTLALLCLLLIYSRKLAKHREQLEARVLSRTLELATARAEAESANAVKTRFMTNVSHEMRTPLQSIIGYSELGQVTLEDAKREALAGYFDNIYASGIQLSGLVESLLSIADQEWNEHAGHAQDPMQEIDVAPFALAISTVMELMAKKAGQQLVMDLQAKVPCFRGDPIRLRQVFEHLMANAVRYSPAGATTILRVTDTLLNRTQSPAGIPAISFQVIDQGCGIPEKEINAVFEPFYESTRTANPAGGTGLGLPLSRCIVARHEGAISIINNPEGGVTCQVLLPIAQLEKTEAGVTPKGSN